MLQCFLLVAPLALASLASPMTSTSTAENVVELSFALRPGRPSLLEETLISISHPASDRYGKHLSAAQATALLEPSQEAVWSVKEWLSDIGANKVEVDGQWIHTSLDSERIQLLAKRGISLTQAGTELPQHVSKHVQLVQQRGIQAQRQLEHVYNSARSSSSISQRHAAVTRADAAKGCASAMTPACLQSLYDIDIEPTTAHPRSLFGIIGFDHQAAQHKELAQFLQAYAPYASHADFSTALVNHGANPQDESQSTGEANLDVQYAIAIANTVPVRFYSVGGENHHFNPDLDLNDTKTEYIEPLLPLAQYLLSLPDSSLPQTVSISFGVNEQLVPYNYAQQVCNMFGQLGARGVSIISGSGDAGPGGACQSNGASGKTKAGEARFLPFWPASCPYVTAVGATQIIESSSSDARSSELCEGGEGNMWEERGVSFSGGGFSDFFARPSWQKGVVGDYLETLDGAFDGLFNRHGRAYPDVAANGWELQYYNHEVVDAFDGTSASTPIFAGVIARLNDQRLRSGKPPLGFLNPWIYAVGSKGFTDITKGSSIGCLGESLSGTAAPKIPGAGWNATRGWDAVTGVGTPQFHKLKTLV